MFAPADRGGPHRAVGEVGRNLLGQVFHIIQRILHQPRCPAVVGRRGDNQSVRTPQHGQEPVHGWQSLCGVGYIRRQDELRCGQNARLCTVLIGEFGADVEQLCADRPCSQRAAEQCEFNAAHAGAAADGGRAPDSRHAAVSNRSTR